MIDIHTHAWQFPDHFDEDFREQARFARGGGEVDLTVTRQAYDASGGAKAERVVVFGGKARRSGLWVDDDYVAQYVAQDPERFIGFLSVDPTQAGWQAEMERGHQELGMQGIKLLSMYAGFYPHDESLLPLWQYASDHQLPVLLHTGTTFVAQAPLDCTLPRHLDPVAARFPDVRIVMAHIGHPYGGEAVVVARKHRHVYTDLSAIHYRPFQCYQTLMLVQEYGVWHKVLFGTDYPFTTVDASIDGLFALNRMLDGSALPRLDEQQIQACIERDSLDLLRLT
jgi:predicted TIM-barrel fold metal-dependent hydrolase